MLYYVDSVNYPQPMQKYLFILLFLVFACEEPAINGCTTTTACNYNIDADKDDGSCIYAEENYDCEGNCIAPLDCNEECGGDAELDECGVCGGSGITDGACDCDGNVADICGVCNGDGTSCYGCTDATACNFDANATIFDDSCWYASEGCECSAGEGASVDNCDVCDA